MRHQVARYALTLFFALELGGFVVGEQFNSSKILFTYKDKQYTVEDLTRVSDKEVSTIIGEISSKYDMKKFKRRDDGYLLPALSLWEPTGEFKLRDYYQYHFQGLIERFIRFEVFNIYKRRHPVDIKRYYRAELVEEAIRRQAEVRDQLPKVIFSALDEKSSDAEIIVRLKKALPESSFKDRDWERSIKSFSRCRPYYAVNRRCFPWMVGGKPAPWVEHTFYSSLIRYHVQSEIERDKSKYIRMLEDYFGRRNYFVIRKAQNSDKQKLLKLINQVTNRKGEVAKGGVEKINKTLQELKSPTRIELCFGAKPNIAISHKIPEDRIKPRKFLSLGKKADGMESYLYIFQEEPSPHFKKYSSAPGNFLYSTAKRSLLRPLVEEIRALIKPAKGVTVRSTDEILNAMGDPIFFETLFGVKLPKVVLIAE